MEVKIVRSSRRRKTVSARLVKDVILINAPAFIPQAHLERIVTNFKDKFQRKRLREELNRTEGLMAVSVRLNEKYFDNKLKVNPVRKDEALTPPFL